MSLDTYVPVPREVIAGGETLAIVPLRVRAIPAFSRAVGPVVGPLLGGRWLEAVAAGGEDLIRAAAIATGESEEWVGELAADEFVALLAAIIEVNADFFVRRVLPTLNAATATTMATLGATPLPS